MKNFIKGVLTGIVATLLVAVPICFALEFHDQTVNRAAKADRLDIVKEKEDRLDTVKEKADRLDTVKEKADSEKPTNPENEWSSPHSGWIVNKATNFCYITSLNYPGLTVTKTHISFTLPAEKDKLGRIDKITIESIFGDVTRQYTKGVDIIKISDTITYMIMLEPKSRISDFGTGGFLNINEHIIELKGSAHAWSQLIRCSKGLEPDY